MADPVDLLPANATNLERELARLGARIEDIDPSAIETLWDAARCPAAHLSRLAAELSIDVWREDWPEATKRQMIAASPEYHAIKGTPRSIEIALRWLGYTVRIIDWASIRPQRRRGTFVVRLLITDMENVNAVLGLTELAGIREAIRRAKPKSRGFALQIGVGFEHQAGGWAKARVIAASRLAGDGGRPTDLPLPAVAWARGRTIAVSRIVGA